MLSKADSTVSEIQESLERASEAVNTWSASLSAGSPGFVDWTCRFGIPVAAVVLGNYGITPTWTMNGVLFITGKHAPKLLNLENIS